MMLPRVVLRLDEAIAELEPDWEEVGEDPQDSLSTAEGAPVRE